MTRLYKSRIRLEIVRMGELWKGHGTGSSASVSTQDLLQAGITGEGVSFEINQRNSKNVCFKQRLELRLRRMGE